MESTYTPEKYRGIGLAEKIIEKAVSFAKEKELKIRPACIYAVSFFQKHPEYEKLLN